MLEILLLFVLGKSIASIAKRKNRNPVGYVLLLVFGWFILGIGGGIVAMGVAIGGGLNEDEAIGPMLIGYLVGVAGAVGVAYLVVGLVSPLRRVSRDYDYDDYDDRPRRRPRDDDPYDYDESDAPRSRRRPRDDYDDDDRPRRRRDDY